MSILRDTCIWDRYPNWVCVNCLSPVKLLKQTSKMYGDCEKCKWCKCERACRRLRWRLYPDSLDLFLGKYDYQKLQ